MPTDPQVKRITIGTVALSVDDYFSAIDQGLALWLDAEKQRTGRADRHTALCRGSCEALARAIEVLRSFARERKLVSVRVTTSMLKDVPHGRLTPSQVFYRWEARIGAKTSHPLRGAPTIGGRTFAVRPVMDTMKRGERSVRVEVALIRRKGLRPEVISLDVDDEVEITHPLRPNDPGQFAAAARKVVRLAEVRDKRLSIILSTVFEQFGVEIKNMLAWSRRRGARRTHVEIATMLAWLHHRRATRTHTAYTLILVSEHGIEEVLIAAAGGGGSTASSSGVRPGIEIEKVTPADEARAVLHDLFQSNIDGYTAAEQNIYDLLDSWPSQDDAEVLRKECVRIQDAADRAIDAAAAELTAQHVIDSAWLAHLRAEASAATREMILGRSSHEATLDLARRSVHGGTKTTAIAGRLAMRAAAGVSEPSAAHRDVIAVTQHVAESLPRFYGTPLLYGVLSERLSVLHHLLERYKESVAG